MGRYQCHQCYREFSRSDSLRRHKDSGVCKEAQTNMSDSDEESVASARRSYAHGRDIFREHDPDESLEEDEEEEDETEDENEEEEDEEEDDDETDDENDGEYDDDSDANVQKIRPWDMLMNITSDNMQDRFNETVEKTLEEYPGTDIQKAEEVAYDKLKPKYCYAPSSMSEHLPSRITCSLLIYQCIFHCKSIFLHVMQCYVHQCVKE